MTTRVGKRTLRRSRDEAEKSEGESRAASAEGSAEASSEKPVDTRPSKPTYPGLGRAVVQPPPGYDPSNPTAYRRQQDAEKARAQPAAAAPTPSRPRGRRRVETGGGGGGRGNYRNNRGRSGGGRGYDRRPSRGKKRRSGPKQASPTPKAQKRKVKVDNVISVRDLGMQL
ncbi:MAG TPA: hypothetical protein ENK18_08630, partial [Deltaproteobacteria bacterium]|nr:hypothetical protein [Deltaproteobacteria bacterium]